MSRNKHLTKQFILPISGDAPTERIKTKNCNGVDLGDVIKDLKLKFENFRDFDVSGVKIRPFPLTLHVRELPVIFVLSLCCSC